MVAPFGWILILATGIGLVLASWLLFGTTEAGMWAGYRVGFIGMIVILAAMALNTSLPKQPTLGLVGLLGIGLILFSVFIDQGHTVFVTELVGGGLLVVGSGLYASGRKA